jgi:integrase
VAEEKELSCERRPKANMFIRDVVKIANVLLSTTEVTYLCGWDRIQLLLYLQLASITASRPSALLQLRYSDLAFTLIRDPECGRPNLFIYIKPEATKRFLGKKAV